MTLHELFDLSTMEHRHLLAAYGVVFLLQAGYLVSVVWNLTRLRRQPMVASQSTQVDPL